ncbi:MAG: lysophospholipid acyltransferase family protein [Nitrospinales bacterium]
MKSIRYKFEYALFVFACFVVSCLSSRGVYLLGRLTGNLSYFLFRKRRRIARINLDIAFGESKSEREKDEIMRKSSVHLAVSALQCLWISAQPQERVHELIDGEPEGVEILKQCLTRNKGVFFLTAHYGNWEFLGLHHGYLGIAPLYSIVRRLDNPYLEKKVHHFRTISGNGVFYKEQSPIKIVRALKNNSCVAVMMDQNMAKDGIFVDFFSKKVAAARSIALLSLSRGTPIMPLFSYPTTKGKYRVVYGPEIEFSKTGNKEKDILNLTQVCEKVLESSIAKQPEPWMWGHRRGKTPPPEEKEIKIYP